MSSHSNRLQELLDSLSLNPRSFALELGMDQATTIYNIFNRDTKISKKLLDKICTRFTQVNREWLMTGHGSMYLGSTALEDDLTVTAKQVLDKLLPLMPDLDLVKNSMDTLRAFMKDYQNLKEYSLHFKKQWEQAIKDTAKYHSKIEKLQEDLTNIKDDIKTITMMRGFEIIKNEEKKKPESNGSND